MPCLLFFEYCKQILRLPSPARLIGLKVLGATTRGVFTCPICPVSRQTGMVTLLRGRGQQELQHQNRRLLPHWRVMSVSSDNLVIWFLIRKTP